MDYIDKFCVEENKVFEQSEPIFSPNKKFSLEITKYINNNIEYEKKTIYNQHNDIVIDIKSDYNKAYSFFMSKGEQWFVADKGSIKVYVNLDTGLKYEDHKYPYNVWISISVSADNKTMAVQEYNSYVSAGLSDINFYDISDPINGCPMLKIDGLEEKDHLNTYEDYDLTWHADTFIHHSKKVWHKQLNKWEVDMEDEDWDLYDDDEMFETVTLEEVVLKRDGDRMLVVDYWCRDDFDKKKYFF